MSSASEQKSEGCGPSDNTLWEEEAAWTRATSSPASRELPLKGKLERLAVYPDYTPKKQNTRPRRP